MNIFVSAAAAGVAALVPLAAGAAPTEPTTPEELTVTATSLARVLQPVQVLEGAELLKRSAPTLGETLANEPGISSSYFGPASSRPIIRGLSGSRVIMLTDSSPTLDVADVSPDHAVTVEPLLADRIEIIRGPTTLLYGSSAAGGIVNVVDSRVPKTVAEAPVSGAVEVRGDTATEERTLVGRLDGGQGAFAWHLDAFTRSTENIDIPGFATADPAERSPDESADTLANSYSDSDGFAAGASWVGSRGFLGASVSRLESTYGLPGPKEEEGDPGEPELFEGPFLDLEQTRIDIRGEYALNTAAFETVRFTLGQNDYVHQEIEPSGEVATRFDNEQWQARVELAHTPVLGFNGVLGVQLDDRDFSAVGEEAFVSATETEALGLFLVEERDFEWGSINLGARVESLEHTNVNLPGYDEDAFSLAAGTVIKAGANNEFVVNLSRTERNANAEELYSDGAHLATRLFEVGLLAPDGGGSADTEVSTNVELGLRDTVGQLTWDTSVYYYDISDYIYLDLTGAIVDELPEAIYTQADAEFYGAEGQAEYRFERTRGVEPSVRVFGDFVRARLADGGLLPRIPPWRAGLTLAATGTDWESSIDVIHHGAQNDVSSFTTDNFTLVNLNYVRRFNAFKTDWELFGRINNLTDAEARRSASFLAAFAPLPGRTLTLGFRARFGNSST